MVTRDGAIKLIVDELETWFDHGTSMREYAQPNHEQVVESAERLLNKIMTCECCEAECPHEAWEQTPAGYRRCADCGTYLPPVEVTVDAPCARCGRHTYYSELGACYYCFEPIESNNQSEPTKGNP